MREHQGFLGDPAESPGTIKASVQGIVHLKLVRSISSILTYHFPVQG